MDDETTVATGDYAFVPVDGDWRVPMVMGSAEEGWLGVCHSVVAWRVTADSAMADPVYPFLHYIEEEEGDTIGLPHRATELCCDERVDDLHLGLTAITEGRRLCQAMTRAWFTARVREETARRRGAVT